MPRKLSALTSWILLIGFGFLVGSQPLYANHKKELAKQAEAAERSGDYEQAEIAYCQLLKEDKKNKTAKAKCDEYTQRNQEMRNKDAEAMAAGKSALAARRFADAIRAFKSVNSRILRDEANRYLTTVIPDAQKAVAAEQARQREQEARNAENLKRGMEAYKQNDFQAAKAFLIQVTGPNSAAAQRVIQDIDRYSAGFGEGFRFEKAGKFKQAAERYREIAKIKPDGPWDIAQRLARVQQQLKAAALPRNPPASSTPAVSGEDSSLTEAIAAFYQGEFEKAATKLSSYSGDGSRKALALFYLGACEVSLQFLAPAGEQANNLHDRGAEHFRDARRVLPTFVPPEQYVSPRILRAFNESVK